MRKNKEYNNEMEIKKEFVSGFDDLGSYTGSNVDKDYYPEQDADDL